jgi:hypothetical protein
MGSETAGQAVRGLAERQAKVGRLPLDLVHEFDFRAMLERPVEIGPGPFGTRRYLGVAEGSVEGERINGTLLGGGDWMLLGPDGWARLEVRFQVHTEDGAVLYVSFPGMLEMNDTVRRAMERQDETAYEDHYWRVAPLLESGDERYSWVNRTLFVGEGRLYPGFGVEYRVYRVQ